MIRPHYWELFSRKVRDRLNRLAHVGSFRPEEATMRCMRLVTGREGKASESVLLYWLVDPTDGIIADARFQAIGPPGLLAAAEIATEFAIRKHYDQMARLTADLLDQQVRDRRDVPAFPPECSAHLNKVLEAIEQAVQQCLDLPMPVDHKTPIDSTLLENQGGIPGWEQLPAQQKRRLVEEVIEKEILPYIELDAGGVKVVDFLREEEIIIAYSGACTTCHSSTGSTLSAIQQMLRSRLHPSLSVTPRIG